MKLIKLLNRREGKPALVGVTGHDFRDLELK